MDRCDQRLGVLHAEGVDARPVLLLQSRTSQTAGRVVLLGMIAATVVERPANNADRVAVGLLAPSSRIHDRHKP
jgi:hypothetical protein